MAKWAKDKEPKALKEVSREQFALWSFERDKKVELYEEEETFESISREEREGYLEEAEYFLSLDKSEWPNDILERL